MYTLNLSNKIKFVLSISAMCSRVETSYGNNTNTTIAVIRFSGWTLRAGRCWTFADSFFRPFLVRNDQSWQITNNHWTTYFEGKNRISTVEITGFRPRQRRFCSSRVIITTPSPAPHNGSGTILAWGRRGGLNNADARAIIVLLKPSCF